MTIYSMRLIAMGIAVLFALGLRDEVAWQSAVLSIGFGHYLLSIWYARRKLSSLSAERRTAMAMSVAVVAGSLLYLVQFPLLVYFAVHHVFNEVYVTADTTRRLPRMAQRQLRTVAVALHTLLYFTLLRGELAEIIARQGNLSVTVDLARLTTFLIALVVLAYACYFFILMRERSALDARALLELSVFEIAGLALLFASFVMPIRFLDVVCYHFVFWWFYPACKMGQRSTTAVHKYAALMIAFVGGAFLVSPAVVPDYPLRESTYVQQFLLWSHIHITSSFFLSNAHPEWIRKWFALPSSSLSGGRR